MDFLQFKMAPFWELFFDSILKIPPKNWCFGRSDNQQTTNWPELVDVSIPKKRFHLHFGKLKMVKKNNENGAFSSKRKIPCGNEPIFQGSILVFQRILPESKTCPKQIAHRSCRLQPRSPLHHGRVEQPWLLVAPSYSQWPLRSEVKRSLLKNPPQKIHQPI